jgi:pimeloyl-ACP methyl ester carboxylesterase
VTLWLALVAWIGLCAALVWWGRRVPPADERHPAPTDDGWVLTLHRFRPPAGVPRKPVPVILGHGILMSRFCWELGPSVSVPRFLAARGHDVWVPEYRGTPSSLPPPGTSRWGYDAREHGWSDVPAILAKVRAVTGAPQASWVGHSMGGLIAYLYAARFGSDALHRLVAIGSPMRFGPGRGPLRHVLAPARFGLGRLRRVPLWPLVFITLPFAVFLPQTGSAFAINPSLLSYRQRAGLFGGSFRDVGAQLHGWFIDLKLGRQTVGAAQDEGHFAPGDLQRLKAPLLVLASAGDRIAPPKSVRPGWVLAGSSTRKYVLFGDGRNEGPPSPVFGHNDLMCSRAALDHVWPRIARWLEADEAELADAAADAGAECPTSLPGV